MPRTPPRRSFGTSSIYLALLAGLSLFGALGCPGNLDPSLLPTGGAGMGGGGTGGAAVCDAPNRIFNPKPDSGCVIPGLCHDDRPLAPGGLNLMAAGIETRLLGVLPTGENQSMCGETTKPYLVPGSDPPDGLLLDKLMPPVPCGETMPTLTGSTLSPSDLECVRQWAASITKP